MIVRFTKFKFPGISKSQWGVQKQPNGKENLIFQFFAREDRSFDEMLFKAADKVWKKVDVGYTEEVGAHDIIMADVTPGTEESLVRVFLKEFKLDYETIDV